MELGSASCLPGTLVPTEKYSTESVFSSNSKPVSNVLPTRSKQPESLKSFVFVRVFPPLGWACLIIAWSIVGGGIFFLTEHHNEHLLIEQHQLVEREYQVLFANNTGVRDMRVIHARRYRFISRNIPTQPSHNRWSFSRAMFFSFTLCSTIGYGYTYPVTRAGKLCSIFYGIIGLVVFAVSFFKIGQSSLRIIDFLMARVWRLFRNGTQMAPQLAADECSGGADARDDDNGSSNASSGRSRSHIIVRTIIILVLMFLVCSIGAIMLKHHQSWTFLNSVYFMFISVSTIGFGDISPPSEVGQAPIPIMGVIFLGLCLFAAGLAQMQEDFERNVEYQLPKILRRVSATPIFHRWQKYINEQSTNIEMEVVHHGTSE